MSKNAMSSLVSSNYPSPEEVNSSRLLDACVQATDRHGLHGLQMNHIIEVSGLSRRTVYKYFKNKSEIVNAAYLREGALLFEGAKNAVAHCASVENIFVNSFLYVYQHLPQHPLMRELIHHNQELIENLNIKQNFMETLQGLDLTVLFQKYPALSKDILALSEYWVQTILSFLLLGTGDNKTIDEVEAYVRKRFVPGLCLADYGIH